MRGFTLVEILVVVGIFSIAVTIVIGSILLSSRSYSEGEKTMEIMQNGRVVLDAISRELRQARTITTSLPEDDIDAPSEIVFQDGHTELISENGIARGGSLNSIILSEAASDEDRFYNNAFIKITDGPSEIVGEIRKVIDYNGGTKEAFLDFSFGEAGYLGSEYMVDTSYYYIHYYLDEGGFVKRRTYSHYFSGDSGTYVPFNAVPPEGETLEMEILEEPRIIGEYFREIRFWGLRMISISAELELRGREINLLKEVFGRNL